MTYLDIRRREAQGKTVFELRGELDMATAPRLRGALDAVCHPASSVLVLDLSHLTFCDAAGLHVFAEYHQRYGTQGCKLLLHSPRTQLRRLLDITQLADVLHLTDW